MIPHVNNTLGTYIKTSFYPVLILNILLSWFTLETCTFLTLVFQDKRNKSKCGGVHACIHLQQRTQTLVLHHWCQLEQRSLNSTDFTLDQVPLTRSINKLYKVLKAGRKPDRKQIEVNLMQMQVLSKHKNKQRNRDINDIYRKQTKCKVK